MDPPPDIMALLAQWAWDPASLNTRVVEDATGRRCIQVRLELGLLQMETSGRPDGVRPRGLDGWLAVAEALPQGTAVDAELAEALHAEVEARLESATNEHEVRALLEAVGRDPLDAAARTAPTTGRTSLRSPCCWRCAASRAARAHALRRARGRRRARVSGARASGARN